MCQAWNDERGTEILTVLRVSSRAGSGDQGALLELCKGTQWYNGEVSLREGNAGARLEGVSAGLAELLRIREYRSAEESDLNNLPRNPGCL